MTPSMNSYNKYTQEMIREVNTYNISRKMKIINIQKQIPIFIITLAHQINMKQCIIREKLQFRKKININPNNL